MLSLVLLLALKSSGGEHEDGELSSSVIILCSGVSVDMSIRFRVNGGPSVAEETAVLIFRLNGHPNLTTKMTQNKCINQVTLPFELNEWLVIDAQRRSFT